MLSPTTIYLIPGFMSPAWMMYPLAVYLESINSPGFEKIVRWDYPRVFSDPHDTIVKLADELDSYPDRSVAIVAHSFGDWIARSALNRTRKRSVSKMVSTCPVVSAVPVAKLAQKMTGDWIPEFSIMASDERTKVDVPLHLQIQQSNIWARGEMLVRRTDERDSRIRERFVWASHNSVLFQPNVWSVIREELEYSHESTATRKQDAS